MRALSFNLLALLITATAQVACPQASLAGGKQIAAVAPLPMPEQADEPPTGKDNYPHIGTLESAILGRPYPGHPLAERLGRMEVKAFGKASTNPDLSSRTDALEDYSQKTLHTKAFDAGSAYDEEQAEKNGRPLASAQSSGQSSDAGANQGANQGSMQGEVTTSKYPHITALETEILGETHVDDSLDARLTRMEMKAYGSKSSSQDYSDRTDALENYSVKKLHKKGFVKEQEKEAIANGGAPANGGGGGGGPVNSQNKLLNFVGNSLLSMAGVGRIGGPALGGNPGMNQGMGGGILPGFSGVRARPRSQVQGDQPTQQQIDNHPEDPSVHDAEPPTAESKMLTKVGWCEVQLFGHTNPAMHLPVRLETINKELNYAPGKSGIALMDSIGGIMKAVQAHKASGKPKAQ